MVAWSNQFLSGHTGTKIWIWLAILTLHDMYFPDMNVNLIVRKTNVRIKSKPLVKIDDIFRFECVLKRAGHFSLKIDHNLVSQEDLQTQFSLFKA